MKSVLKHWRLWLASLLVAVLVGWWLRPTAVEVETTEVTAGPLRETIDQDGETRVRDRFVIAAPVAGRLDRVGLRAGDEVTRGGLLGWLEPAPLDARLLR